MVIAGCAGELVFVIHEYLDARKDWYKARTRRFVAPPEKPSSLVLILELLSVAFVVVGIAGELYIDRVSGRLETQLRDANGKLVLLLEQKAGDAKTSAIAAAGAAERAKKAADGAKIKADAVGVEADAVGLKVSAVSNKAEQIDIHLTGVEYALSARFVQDEDGLRDELRKDFKESHIAFRSYAEDGEAFWLCSQLAQIAEKAGVEPKFECGMEPPAMVPVSDLSVKAPTIDEAQHLGMILVRPGRVALPGHAINSGIGPLTVFVGTKASVRLWWPKAEKQSLPKAPNSNKSAKP